MIKRETTQELNDRLRRVHDSDEEYRKLHSSRFFRAALGVLQDKPRRYVYLPEGVELDIAVAQLVMAAMREPDVAETMTGTERKKLAEKILGATSDLREALAPFVGAGDYGFKWPFQPHFDKLALETSIDDAERWRQDGEDSEDIEHRTRFAIYHLLMRRMDWLFDAIDTGAEHFAETETILKKPNDANARRLYFLRVITRRLVAEFGSPCRAAALSLASIYFDCSDLDEASISKLAPVVKPKPVEISKEEFDDMTARMEQALEEFAARPGADPESVQELRDELNKMRETAYKAQQS